MLFYRAFVTAAAQFPNAVYPRGFRGGKAAWCIAFSAFSPHRHASAIKSFGLPVKRNRHAFCIRDITSSTIDEHNAGTHGSTRSPR
jgi:hypothetical protein